MLDQRRRQSPRMKYNHVVTQQTLDVETLSG